jgi:hypothetical protein
VTLHASPIQPTLWPLGSSPLLSAFGIQGSGKSTLLEKFKLELGTDTFTFYDGSQALADVLSGMNSLLLMFLMLTILT